MREFLIACAVVYGLMRYEAAKNNPKAEAGALAQAQQLAQAGAFRTALTDPYTNHVTAAPAAPGWGSRAMTSNNFISPSGIDLSVTAIAARVTPQTSPPLWETLPPADFNPPPAMQVASVSEQDSVTIADPYSSTGPAMQEATASNPAFSEPDDSTNSQQRNNYDPENDPENNDAMEVGYEDANNAGGSSNSGGSDGGGVHAQ